MDPESHMRKETENSSSRFRRENEVSARQRPYRRVSKPRRYEGGNFETQFRRKERTREQREAEEVKSVMKSTSIQEAMAEGQDAARQQ